MKTKQEDFITILLEQNKNRQNTKIATSFLNPQHNTIWQQIKDIPHHILEVNGNRFFEEKTLPQKIDLYMAALDQNLQYVSQLPKSELELITYSEGKSDINKSVKLLFSPYHELLFQYQSPKRELPDEINQKEIPPKGIFPLNISYHNYNKIKFKKILEHIAVALRKSIEFCPYCKNATLPSKTNRIHDCLEYDIWNGKYVIDITNTQKFPGTIRVLNREIQEAFLSLGGPGAIEQFMHLTQLSYKNKNLRNPNRIKRFFSETYSQTINHLKENLSPNTETLFNYFSLEKIFNGSFFIYFCTFYSSGSATSNLVDSLKKVNCKITYLEVLSNLYISMNQIENPFLKHKLLENIVYPSFYKQYKYNGKEQPAGKTNPIQWMKNLTAYSQNLAFIEKKLYQIILPSPYNIDALCQEYEKLFQVSSIYTNSSSHRGMYYKEILPKIALDNYNYYSK